MAVAKCATILRTFEMFRGYPHIDLTKNYPLDMDHPVVLNFLKHAHPARIATYEFALEFATVSTEADYSMGNLQDIVNEFYLVKSESIDHK